jgi:hypothetical protein
MALAKTVVIYDLENTKLKEDLSSRIEDYLRLQGYEVVYVYGIAKTSFFENKTNAKKLTNFRFDEKILSDEFLLKYDFPFNSQVSDFHVYWQLIQILYSRPEVTAFCIVASDKHYFAALARLKNIFGKKVILICTIQKLPEYRKLCDLYVEEKDIYPSELRIKINHVLTSNDVKSKPNDTNSKFFKPTFKKEQISKHPTIQSIYHFFKRLLTLDISALFRKKFNKEMNNAVTLEQKLEINIPHMQENVVSEEIPIKPNIQLITKPKSNVSDRMMIIQAITHVKANELNLIEVVKKYNEVFDFITKEGLFRTNDKFSGVRLSDLNAIMNELINGINYKIYGFDKGYANFVQYVTFKTPYRVYSSTEKMDYILGLDKTPILSYKKLSILDSKYVDSKSKYLLILQNAGKPNLPIDNTYLKDLAQQIISINFNFSKKSLNEYLISKLDLKLNTEKKILKFGAHIEHLYWAKVFNLNDDSTYKLREEYKTAEELMTYYYQFQADIIKSKLGNVNIEVFNTLKNI